ncbi:MAG: hypothetical protein ACKVPX_04110 [Myxococcaceae bacterium]
MNEIELKEWNRVLAHLLADGNDGQGDELTRKVEQMRGWAQRLFYDACPDDARVREAEQVIREKHPWMDGANVATLLSHARYDAERDGKRAATVAPLGEVLQGSWEGQLAAADWAAEVNGRD